MFPLCRVGGKGIDTGQTIHRISLCSVKASFTFWYYYRIFSVYIDYDSVFVFLQWLLCILSMDIPDAVSCVSKTDRSVYLLQTEASFQRHNEDREWYIGETEKRRVACYKVEALLFCCSENSSVVENMIKVYLATLEAPCLPFKREPFVQWQQNFYHASPIWAPLNCLACIECLVFFSATSCTFWVSVRENTIS